MHSKKCGFNRNGQYSPRECRRLEKSSHKSGNEAMHARLLAVAIRKQAPLYAEVIQQGHDEGVFIRSADWNPQNIRLLQFNF